MSLITQGGHYEWSFTNGANTYTIQNIISGTLTESVYEQIAIGNAVARKLELLLWNVTLDPTSPIVLSVKAINADGTYSTYARGTYLIDTIGTSPYSENTQVVAFDAMMKADVPYMRTGTWTETTDYAVVSNIVSDMGVSIESATDTLLSGSPMVIDEAPSIGDNGTTDRDFLGVIAAMRGGNFYINDDNKLELIPLTGRSVAATDIGDEVVNFDKSPTETVKRVEIWAGSSQYFRHPMDLTEAQWEALGGIVLMANMPLMASQTLADDLYTAYYNATYVPFTANGAYVPAELALGSPLTIKNTSVLITQRTLNIDTLATSNMEAQATEQQASYYPTLMPIDRAVKQDIRQMSSSITVLDDRIEQEVSDLTEGYTTLVTNTAKEILQEFTDYTNGVKKYIRFSASGITIGDENSNFKTQIDDSEVGFYGSDGQKAAYINNTQMYITEAVIKKDQKFETPNNTGNWVQQVGSDNQFQIKWIGN